ncbi:MAG: rRNA maturation RNase YbeY [Gammaproteobacteria bacterium]|nr:MAG: rRNA maturation RNase YbeY [Gammaproteobacteria bacterium]
MQCLRISMTSSVAHARLTTTFTNGLRELPFPKGFSKRFSLACEVFESFLKDAKLNGFSQKYKMRSHFYLNVGLVGDQRMRTMNRDFRAKDKTTDVLTLALYDDIRAGEELLFEEVELGDIFISGPVMKKQAKEFNVTIEQEFFHLFVHGFLHLLGFDHEISPEEEKLMEALEKKLVDKIYKKIY